MSRIRSNRVCFTHNNYEEKTLQLWELYAEDNKEKIKFLVIGQEIGDNGTPHLQGFIHLDMEAAKGGIKFWKNEIPGGHKCHFEAARGTDEQSKKYCTKEGAFFEIGEPSSAEDRMKAIYEMAKIDVEKAVEMDYTFGIRNYFALERIHFKHAPKKRYWEPLKELRPWQEKVLAKLKDQDDRKILIVVDEIGNNGKTSLTRHLKATEKCWSCTGGKMTDLMNIYNEEAEYAVFDMTRTNDAAYYPWSMMEACKNGMFTATKYQGGEKEFKPAKVVVFMNEDPPMNKFSRDRYDIYRL